ncbi:GTP pyrophosphokinase [Niveibacterium microcysteis]|uniref:RelA/SpoT domain-containing protein n=1 Tax=Niveibacterium microcysteis TaxID=2811415 RepID=A0ABX7MC04_9RHOO|nr:hypothetical protein [Niveibacterium microcysteis]QSI78678.1 hypothetical protein JY500_08760 [Niveibacterium microcysteis]
MSIAFAGILCASSSGDLSAGSFVIQGEDVASLDFDKEKSSFREWYDSKRTVLARVASQLENLIATLTSSSDDIEEPIVSHRIKDREECIKKFALKYQTGLESTSTEYEIRDHITDLVGLRVVCYYETDIARVVKVLRENFEVVCETNKSAELEAQDNVFGYKGHHLDLRVNGDRANLPEYGEYLGLRFEVQVRSTIQDAWSVLDHKIKYKKSIPHELKRKINALAALFEIADREFTDIKEVTERFKKGVQADIGVASQSASKPLDVFEFLALTQPRFPDYQFQGFKADGFVQEINRWSSKLDVATFKTVLETHMAKVDEYAKYQKSSHGNELNPFTKLRHALYLHNRDDFKLVLYDVQRSSFDKWLAEDVEGKR